MFMINLRNGEIYVIKLKTFGSFTVGNDLTSVQEGAWRSKKLEKLFVYLQRLYGRLRRRLIIR